VHALKECGGGGGLALHILNLDTVWQWVVNLRPGRFIPWQQLLVPSTGEAGWGYSVGLYLCRREQMSPRRAQSLYRHCSIEFVSRLFEITLALFIKEKPKLTCTSYSPIRNNRAT